MAYLSFLLRTKRNEFSIGLGDFIRIHFKCGRSNPRAAEPKLTGET